MPTRQQILDAVRADHPEFAKVDGTALWGALKADHPDIAGQAFEEQRGGGEAPAVPKPTLPPELQGKPDAPGHHQPSIGGQGNEPGLPSFITTGLSKLGHVVPSIANGNFAHAANDALGGAGRLSMPLAVPAIAAAPVAAMGAAALGTAGSMGGSAAAGYMGASPEQQELAGNIGGALSGALGGAIGSRAAKTVPNIVKAASSPQVQDALVKAIPKGKEVLNLRNAYREATGTPANPPLIATGRPTGGKLFGDPGRSKFMTPPVPEPEPSLIVQPSGIVGMNPRPPRPDFSMGESTPVPSRTTPQPGPRSMFSVAPEYKSPFDPRDTRIVDPAPKPQPSISSNPEGRIITGSTRKLNKEIKSIVTARERNGGIPKPDAPLPQTEPASGSGDRALNRIESNYRADEVQWGNRIAKADRFARELQRTGQPVPVDESGWARFARSIGEREVPHEDTRQMIQERMARK